MLIYIYKTAIEKLDNTKENLFKQKDISVWKLNHQDLENKNAFLKNKDLAFSKMLPRDTKRVQIFNSTTTQIISPLNILLK